MENQSPGQDYTGPGEVPAKRESGHRLGTVGWGLFFIWIGVAFLAELSLGVVLMGVGVITLFMQVLRSAYKLKLEWFWVAIGVLFLVGGIWELWEPELPLIPVLLIVAGLLLFLSAACKQRKN
ncbi:MAG: hypothetical protein JSW34_10240 [Candidatus Zixiibacteriota bacterium]|nr:MAG: hypothetical protein JSW34_10240 [candidate division Zixibacteria bacterium]